jgi:hypothetical protein
MKCRSWHTESKNRKKVCGDESAANHGFARSTGFCPDNEFAGNFSWPKHAKIFILLRGQ